MKKRRDSFEAKRSVGTAKYESVVDWRLHNLFAVEVALCSRVRMQRGLTYSADVIAAQEVSVFC
jgi:hypothetical protein